MRVQNCASVAVALASGPPPHDQQRRDERRQPDGEGREDDVEGDGEGELQSGQENGIERHRGSPPSHPAPGLVSRSGSAGAQGGRPTNREALRSGSAGRIVATQH